VTIDPLSKDVFLTRMEQAQSAGSVSANALKRFWDWAYKNNDGLVQTCAFPVPTEGKDKNEMGKGKWVHARSYEEFKDFCVTHSDMWRYHVYAGVNTLDKEPNGGRGTSEHIDTVNHLSFDIETERDSYSGASKEEVWWCYRYALAQSKFMNEEYGVWPMIVMSENGIHCHFKTDFVTSKDKMNGKSHVYSKYITKQAMTCDYAKQVKKNAPDIVDFDQDDVSDVPRVMKVPGTRGIKSNEGRLCGIIHEPSKENAGVITPDQVTVPSDAFDDKSDNSGSKDKVQSVNVESSDASADVMTRVKSLCKKDDTFRTLFYGDTSGYESRSEAEMAFAMKMLNHGFTKDEIPSIFESSGMTKWDEESNSYRESTLDKAVQGFDGKKTKDSTNGSFDFSRCG